MSTSLLIDALSVIITVSSKSQVKLIFPKALGFMFSSDETIHALCYFNKAQFSAGHYFSFPFPNFIFNLKIKPEFIDALLMVGDIEIIGQSKQLSNVASLVNEILSTFDKPKSETQNNNASITSTSSTPISSPISPRRSPFSSKNKVKFKNDALPVSTTAPANGTSIFKLLFTFHFLKIEVKVDELSTSLVLNQTLAEVRSKNSVLSWGFNVFEVKGKVFDSILNTSICGKKSKSKNKLSFTVTPFDFIISHNLFNKIPLFARFAIVILNGFKKQKHVNSFLLQLNDHIQQHAENRHENLFEVDELNRKLDFPSILSNYISFSIQNVNIQLLLPPSGATVVSIPEISLDVKVKNSPLHSKQAIGAKFQIQNFYTYFDTEENLMSDQKVKKKNHLSYFHITQFVVSALLFQNDIDLESIVDGINLKIYPTIPYAIAKLLLSIFALTANVTKAKEIIEKNEESNQSSNPLLGSPRSRSRTISTINVPHRNNDINRISSTRRSIASKIVTKIITGFIACKNFEINLSPVDNKLVVPSVELRFMLKNTSRKQKKNNDVSVSLFIPQKIEASFTPELIHFLGSLKRNLSVLSEESINSRQEQYIEQQKELKKIENQEKKEKEKQKKQKQKEKEKESSTTAPALSIHNRTKSTISSIDLIDEDDDISNFTKKLSSNISIVFYSKDIEVCFSCQPRRNDVSVRIGISSFSLVVSTQSEYISAQLVNFYLKTHNIFSMRNDKKTAQLFQFVIPQIDALLSKNKVIVEVEKIISSFSSDKVEEITLFNDIWFQPLLKMIGSDEEENENNINNINLTEVKSDGKLIQNTSLINESSTTLSQYDDDVEADENKKPTKKVFDMEINLAIKAIELTFNYATGHGSINLTLRPIYLSKTRELIYASINSISVNSDGQLSCIFDIENVYFISKDSNHSLTNVIHLNDIKISMEMAGETFFFFLFHK